MSKKRKPRFRGSGYMMGFVTKDMVKGDTAWDVDFGHIVFDGKKWKNEVAK